ncbi:hypothetical protein EfmAA290_07610 [Enterococcus faecium]|nr:hypothetical protein EfmAA290_07610 [Enterococcus faecium]
MLKALDADIAQLLIVSPDYFEVMAADEHWEGSIFQITTYMKCLQIRHKEFVRDKKR